MNKVVASNGDRYMNKVVNSNGYIAKAYNLFL